MTENKWHTENGVTQAGDDSEKIEIVTFLFWNADIKGLRKMKADWILTNPKIKLHGH